MAHSFPTASLQLFFSYRLFDISRLLIKHNYLGILIFFVLETTSSNYIVNNNTWNYCGPSPLPNGPLLSNAKPINLYKLYIYICCTPYLSVFPDQAPWLLALYSGFFVLPKLVVVCWALWLRLAGQALKSLMFYRINVKMHKILIYSNSPEV